MADTMKFGPEWLRALSDGSQSAGSTAPPNTKFKMAEYRYGREEMLTLYQDRYETPPVLKKFPLIVVEDTQTPIALMPLSEDEQRLIAQGVNSQTVMRPGRGAQTGTRGGRAGLMVDRGRSRGGRGRGEIYSSRGGLENGDIGGGFSRSRGPNKDGWEEVGNRKVERGFSRPFDDVGREGHPRFSRSMSDNWRDKGPADEDDENDWRKPANKERWSTRTNWREPGRGGHDIERREGGFLRNRGFDPEDRGRRMDVPEWIDDGSDDVGSFDASGAFVSNREQPYFRNRKEEREDQLPTPEDPPPPQDHERQGGGPQQQQREQDGWESSDSGQEVNEVSNDVGGHSSQGSREDSGPATEEEIDASSGGLGQLPASRTLSSSAPDVLPEVAAAGEEPSKIIAPVVPVTHENGLKWYYVDPQENLQGPFASEDMAQWFSAGYFTMCLKVKRGCDHDFQPLGDLMKQWGHVPFVPGPIHHPILPQTTASPQEAAPTPAIHAAVSLPPPAPAPAPAPAPSAPASSFSLGQGAGGTESLLVQQQLLIQHQILQLEVELRQLQMQTLSQLQEQDSFKALDPARQQQVSMHIIQSNPLLQQRMQHLQQLRHMQQQTQQTQQQLQLLSQGPSLPAPAVSSVAPAPVTSLPPTQQQSQPLPSVSDIAGPSSSPAFSVPDSQPTSTGEGQGQGDIPSIWGSGPPAGGWPPAQPTSVWELENSLPPPPVKADLEKMRKEKEEEFARLKEAERKQQEEIQKQQEELRRQAEALQREREQMEREKEELERQRILELQRVGELRRQQEEEQRRRGLEEAQRRKQEEEEIRRKQMEEHRRREEEESQRRREEEHRRSEEERRREEERRKQEEEEWRKQEDIRRKREAEELALQEMKRMEEMRQQQEAERQRQRELEKQHEAEAAQKKKELERQQQEALRRMQQQQALQNIQLPSSANWARQQQQQVGQSVQSRSLAEIQQEEEVRQLQQERERQHMQRLQEEQQQLQQQQQTQKTWGSNLVSQQPPRVKTLAEIQEEEERQLRQEKQKTRQQQQHQTKTMSISEAAVWGSGPRGTQSSSSSSSSTPWSGTNSIWGAPAPSSIWGNGNPAPSPKPSKKVARDNSNSNQVSAEFPSLHSQKSNKSKQTASRAAPNASAPSKSKKEEEAVQRLFKEATQQRKDEFTMWCEAFLEGMDGQVDIETFVSFLKEVDSPYEVHDYVKSYLGDSKKAQEFAKMFLEKRSHFNNKARKEKQQEEESIWGPAPAVNPQKIRGNSVQTSNVDHGFTEVGGKSKGAKKKKKMQKLDGSALLGFTVAKDPNRKNAGEIESID